MEHADRLDSGPIHVLIEHEVRILREGLASLLSQQPEVTVVTPVPNGTTHKEHQTGLADVVLLDAGIKLDAEALADRIQNLCRTWPSGRVIVLGVAESVSGILDWIEAGAGIYYASLWARERFSVYAAASRRLRT